MISRSETGPGTLDEATVAAADRTAGSSTVPHVTEQTAESDPKRTHVLVVDARRSWSRWWSDVFIYRGALRSLMWRNVRSRYKQAVLGVGWALLQPALQVSVFTLVFALVARVPTGDVPYPLFALAGLIPWNLFSKVVSEGATSLVTNQHIITKLFFPRIYLVLAAGASAIIDAAISLALLAGLMIWYQVRPTPMLVLALPALFGILIAALGIATFLAALNARWRDVQHTLPLLLQIGVLVTPVAYHASFFPKSWQWLVAINPLAGLIELFRASLLGQPLPDARVLVTSLTVCAALAVGGLWLFTRSEAKLVDVV
jgi:lipopolysaccharide transport system permease protein